MIVSSLEELDSFKYSDLQNLAKNLGLRANLRADKLLRALKAHLKNEAKEENESQDEVQTSASSCDETEVQTSSREQAEREPIGHVTKTRKRRRTLHRSADPQDHSEIKICDPPEFQSQEEHESQALQAAVEVPSVPNESQGDENAVPSGKSGINGMSNNLKKKKIQKHTHTKKRSSRHEREELIGYIKNKINYVLATPVPLRGRRSGTCNPASPRRSQGRPHTRQSTLCRKGSTKRPALSATKMNVRFSAATQDNEHKRSLTKTPARKSPHVTTSGNTPKGQAVFGTHKLKTTAVITPFKLTTEASQTPISQRKPVFDLKASLSRPLTYEPHKGKLKPWGQSKENSSLSQHGNRVSFHKKTYKQPHLQTREEQRKKHEQERKEKKAKVLEVRRGLIMAKH
uniref:Nucleolar and spindle associated protein 1 n=1 Tax=Catagonus wagneri TaxID=51154 RepID=A0A8C3VIC8_9CETA